VATATCKATGLSSSKTYTATATYGGDTNYLGAPGTSPGYKG
jgi:hypothetical protein